MLRNYIKTAFRSLIKQKVYTGINVIGLAVSITASLLIVLYVKHELSYDKFFPGADRIFKMVLERKYPNHVTHYSVIPHSFAKAMQQDFPEVESTLHLFGPNKNSVITYKVKEGEVKSFEEDYILQADSSFFKFFDFELIKGDKETALASANQVIISEATAEKYFGKEDALGKVLGGDFGEMKVTAVFKNLPDNSHLRFDFVGSVGGPQFRQFINRENYTGFDSHTYIKLKPGTDPKALEAKFPKMVDTYAAAHIEHDLGKSWEDYKKAGNGYVYTLQPLTSIHLDPSNLELTITPSGNLKYVYILSFIAILIVVIACINFMNLSTARSAERAREVGVRKVMGSIRSQLIIQFLTEAILLSLIGMVIAIAGVYMLLPSFNDLVEKQLQLVFSANLILVLTAFTLIVGVLAGLYPAFALSSYNPVVVMKGNFSGSSKGSWLRNGLVVFQFMISIVLIVGTIVIGQQMKFMQNKNLGFNKEQILMVKRAFALDKKTETFVEEIRRMSETQSVASTSSIVGNRDDFFGQQFQPEGSSEILTVKSMVMDDDFAGVIGFELKEGRLFSKETNDSLNILLNETAVKTMGMTDPVGKRLSQVNNNPDGSKTTLHFTIVGVIKDFHFQSLRDEITPLVIYDKELFGKQGGSAYVAARLKADKFREAISKIEMKWKEIVPEQPFKYEFLDENLKQGYLEEQRSGKLFAVFSGLAIAIACVGLFGLSAYTASLRTKEIGIRKVLGSSVSGVVVLLSKDFTKLVLIAFVLAVPLSGWLLDTWLKGFAYRVDLGISSFIIAGILALAIAWLTVSYQSIKAAIVNPVRSLKSE
ncbi:MAG TPA: ABC transporter permease [Cyclobacteriaceae bacterium]|jgi:putative ABC transport system permease protein|nr:ABC transporter permease [Cyclobacteriaceae bacterium]